MQQLKVTKLIKKKIFKRGIPTDFIQWKIIHDSIGLVPAVVVVAVQVADLAVVRRHPN